MVCTGLLFLFNVIVLVVMLPQLWQLLLGLHALLTAKDDSVPFAEQPITSPSKSALRRATTVHLSANAMALLRSQEWLRQ